MPGVARLESVLVRPRRRLLRAFAACGVAVAALACWSPSAAHAAAKAPYTVAVTPTSVVAGSTGRTFVFTFTSIGSTQSRVAVTVPSHPGRAAWTSPQSADPAGAGYVSIAKGTCNTAAIAGISGSAGQPRTILVDTKCAKGKTFALTYGAGAGAKVTAPTTAGPYTVRDAGRGGRLVRRRAGPARRDGRARSDEPPGRDRPGGRRGPGAGPHRHRAGPVRQHDARLPGHGAPRGRRAAGGVGPRRAALRRVEPVPGLHAAGRPRVHGGRRGRPHLHRRGRRSSSPATRP